MTATARRACREGRRQDIEVVRVLLGVEEELYLGGAVPSRLPTPQAEDVTAVPPGGGVLRGGQREVGGAVRGHLWPLAGLRGRDRLRLHRLRGSESGYGKGLLRRLPQRVPSRLLLFAPGLLPLLCGKARRDLRHLSRRGITRGGRSLHVDPDDSQAAATLLAAHRSPGLALCQRGSCGHGPPEATFTVASCLAPSVGQAGRRWPS